MKAVSPSHDVEQLTVLRKSCVTLTPMSRVHRVDAFDSDESHAPDGADDSDAETDRE